MLVSGLCVSELDCFMFCVWFHRDLFLHAETGIFRRFLHTELSKGPIHFLVVFPAVCQTVGQGHGSVAYYSTTVVEASVRGRCLPQVESWHCKLSSEPKSHQVSTQALKICLLPRVKVVDVSCLS